MEQLACKGGPKAVQLSYPPHPVVGEEERKAVERVFNNNQFSQFIASDGKNFLGGPEVKAFEDIVAKDTNCEYGVAYNSWTSGLHAAVAACEPKFGDAIFTTPYTFTSSATCALMNNCAPIFVDVDPITCNITAETLEVAIKTYPSCKILVLVHLFGLPADMDDIMSLCHQHGIRVIEDAAQSIGATYKGRKIGSIGDCGGFSFTQSKTIMCGEGGVLVTNDKGIAERAQMVRNHGEIVADQRTYNSEILGMGYRITEIAAAIGTEQWKKLPMLNQSRIDLNQKFQKFIKDKCDFITFQEADYDCQHVYYTTSMMFDSEKAGVSRNTFVDAVVAEGVPIYQGYCKPLYLQTLYQKRNHFVLRNRGDIDYHKGLCPNAEDLHFNRLFFTMALRNGVSDELLGQIQNAFSKVIGNIGNLPERS